MIMSSSNHIQFLDDNFLTNSSSTINSSAAPVSTLYGGSPGVATSPTASAALASFSTKLRDGTDFSGASQLFTVALSSSQSVSNIVINLSDDIDTNIVVLDSGSSGFASASRYNGWRIAPDMYYVYLPSSASSATWSIVFTTSSSVSISDIFFGSSVDLNTPLSRGFSHSVVDPSVITYADSGRAYSVLKAKYQTISGITLSYLNRHQINALKEFSEDKGLTEPFWAVLDPENKWDGPAFGMSFGAYTFSSMPVFAHDFLDKFSASFDLREGL